MNLLELIKISKFRIKTFKFQFHALILSMSTINGHIFGQSRSFEAKTSHFWHCIINFRSNVTNFDYLGQF
jgi:hypothetical protein